MGFFDQLPPQPPEPEPRIPARPPWLRPEAELPGVVAVELVVVHTAQAAVAVSGLRAFGTGFEFTLSTVLRHEDRWRRVFDPRVQHHLQPGEQPPPTFVRFGLEFADGSVATNLAPHPVLAGRSVPAGPILAPNSGGGSGRRYDMRYWVWPLPPPGPLTFVCQWPALDIGESRAQLDAGLVLEAARRSVELWPETAPG